MPFVVPGTRGPFATRRIKGRNWHMIDAVDPSFTLCGVPLKRGGWSYAHYPAGLPCRAEYPPRERPCCKLCLQNMDRGVRPMLRYSCGMGDHLFVETPGAAPGPRFCRYCKKQEEPA